MLKKQIITVIFSIMPFINIYSQQIVDISTYENCTDGCNDNKYYKDLNNSYDKFLGVWESTTGNMTFQVIVTNREKVNFTLAQNSFRDEITLKYIMIKNKGLPTESIIYRSDKMINNTIWETVFTGIYTSGNEFGGAIMDNSITTNPKYSYRLGRLSFILDIANPQKAHWVVKELKGMKLSDIPDFNIPTDIILMK